MQIKYLFLFLPLFMTLHCLWAQTQINEADSSITLQAIELSAPYLANLETPISFQNLSQQDFAYKNVGQEPSFILSETPSMTIYSDAGSYQGYSYFRLRGIDQTRINLSLDGIPLNEPEDQGVYFSNYPDFFQSIAGVQIQRGVGTSQNGTASYAGSLNFSSPSLFDSSGMRLSAGYGSYNSYRISGAYNSGIKNNKGFSVQASQIHSDGYKDRSANTSQSLFYSGGLFEKKHSFKLSGFVGRQANQMAWLGVSEEQLNNNRRSNANTQEDDLFTQSLTYLQHSWYPTEHATLRSSIYYNYLQGNYDFDLNNFLGFASTDELLNYAFQSHFAGLFSNFVYQKNQLTWTTGFHSNWYSRQHTGTEKVAGFLYENTGYKREASVFSKIQYRLGQWSLFADAQYRYTDFSFDGGSSFSPMMWQFLNPKAGLLFHLSPQSHLYYSIGRTGREPTRTDIFGGWDDPLVDSLSGKAVLFIADAESVIDQELGYRFRSDRWQLALNTYYMVFDNEIVLAGQFGPNGLALNSKVDRSFRAGIELDASLQLNPHLQLRNNSSFAYHRIQDQGTVFFPILSPPLLLNQEIIYRHHGWLASLSLRYQGASYLDFANTASVDGYFLANARLSYSRHQWQFAIHVNNLSNSHYSTQAYLDYDGSVKYFAQAPINGFLTGEVRL